MRRRGFMKKLLIVNIFFLFIVGCAVQKPVVQKVVKPEEKAIPPGIDKKTAAFADSLFFQSNVTEINERIAKEYSDQAKFMSDLVDSIWVLGSKEQLSGLDSAHGLKYYSEALEYIKISPEEYKLITDMAKRQGKFHPDVIKKLCRALIKQTSFTYENAIRKNKLNFNYRQLYSRFLQRSFDKLQDRTYLIEASQQLEIVVDHIKNFHQLYSQLGNIYFKLGEWQKSVDRFEQSKYVLKNIAIFSLKNPEVYFDRIEDVPVDTTRLVYFLSYQAECKIKLYEAAPALALLREARKLTPNNEYKKRFKKRIEWILWDEGNIRASEIKDRADSLLIEKEYETAKTTLLELLPLLWTQKTKDEVNWKIARVDFFNLDNKEEGISRMQLVIKHARLDSLTGAPLDSLYQRYFDFYGKMCFSLGTKYLKDDLCYAYIYFQQAAQVVYDERGKAFVQLADISKFDASESLALCKKAMKYDLDEQSKKILYRILYQCYRKLGDFDNAKKWFDQWQNN